MSPEAQRIAIAEECGWKIVRDEYGVIGSQDGTHWHSTARFPDYLNDLNAMHEAEKVMTEKHRVDYSSVTYDIACRAQEKTGHWNWISLSAAQRAEAFLRTIGKWEGGAE